MPGFEKDVWGFDVVTGKNLWTFHTVPHPGEFGYETWDRPEEYGANCWGGMAMAHHFHGVEKHLLPAIIEGLTAGVKAPLSLLNLLATLAITLFLGVAISMFTAITVTSRAIEIEVLNSWWISNELNVFCHQSKPHLAMGKVK